jgi:LysR family cys regulon transcriptional activator
LVLPKKHPLATQSKPITLKDLSQYPLVTYHPSFTGRQKIDAAFEQKNLNPSIALEAIDSDVIKTYVRIGMGVGIVAEMSILGNTDQDLVIKPAGDLFGRNVTKVAFKRGSYLRQYVIDFAALLSPSLTAASIQKALSKTS